MASFFLPFIDSINCKKLMDGKKLETERGKKSYLLNYYQQQKFLSLKIFSESSYEDF